MEPLDITSILTTKLTPSMHPAKIRAPPTTTFQAKFLLEITCDALLKQKFNK